MAGSKGASFEGVESNLEREEGKCSEVFEVRWPDDENSRYQARRKGTLFEWLL